MKKVEITPELKKRIEILEAKYPTAKEFAEALGVEPSYIRHIKTGYRKHIGRPIFLLIEIREEQKRKK